MSPMLLADDPLAMQHGKEQFWGGFVAGFFLGVAIAATTGLIWWLT